MAPTGYFLNLMVVFSPILEKLSFLQTELLKELVGFLQATVEGSEHQIICVAHRGAGLYLLLLWTATLSLS